MTTNSTSKIKIATLFCALLVLCGCSEKTPDTGRRVAVLTAPVGAIVRAVAGDAVEVSVIVPPGKDAHEYEPAPGDLRGLQHGGVYLSLGMAGELRLANAVVAAGGRVRMLAPNLERLPFDDHDHDHGGDGDAGEFGDPHVWMSPENCAVIAVSCGEILTEIYPDHAAGFRASAAEYAAEMRALADRIAVDLSPYRGAEFYVFHPAFGYFARDFGLVQRAVEPAGKNPSPRELEAVLADARASGVTVLYAGTQFNPALPAAAAEMLGCRLEMLDPLPEDPAENFVIMTAKLKRGFEEKK
ncbi:MAG: zinc ABC transporter substrate-binding protein [Victivallaceae bacterium]|nr:zinc ABC transporter substrate-binding protein [Victivallaceae bacterium]